MLAASFISIISAVMGYYLFLEEVSGLRSMTVSEVGNKNRYCIFHEVGASTNRSVYARSYPHQGRAPIFASTRLILRIRRSKSIGFVSNSSQPAASARSREPVMACAVSAMIGMC